MKINKKLLPIKIHYFFFLGCISPILPFLMVIARQLGIPVLIHGTVGSVIFILTLVIKPFVASLADAFPKARKAIFIAILTMMVCMFFSFNFLPPMHGLQKIGISGEIFSFDDTIKSEQNFSHSNASLYPEESELMYLLTTDEGLCYPQELWDCKTTSASSVSVSVPNMLLIENRKDLQIMLNSSKKDFQLAYHLEKAGISSVHVGTRMNFSCEGGLYGGEPCRSIWENPSFYVYLLLFTVGYIAFAITNSFSDAICVDIVGEDGDYGSQRVWGTVGWGLMGPVSGFLIDWYSGDKAAKNYLPAFLILFVLGSTDILLSAAKLKYPQIPSDLSYLWVPSSQL